MLHECSYLCACIVTLCTKQHTHPFNGPFSGTTWVYQYQKGITNLNFTEARDSEWQCHCPTYSWAICKSVPHSRQITQHPTTQFLLAKCPSCCPTNSVKALEENYTKQLYNSCLCCCIFLQLDRHFCFPFIFSTESLSIQSLEANGW